MISKRSTPMTVLIDVNTHSLWLENPTHSRRPTSDAYAEAISQIGFSIHREWRFSSLNPGDRSPDSLVRQREVESLNRALREERVRSNSGRTPTGGKALGHSAESPDRSPDPPDPPIPLIPVIRITREETVLRGTGLRVSLGPTPRGSSQVAAFRCGMARRSRAGTGAADRSNAARQRAKQNRVARSMLLPELGCPHT